MFSLVDELKSFNGAGDVETPNALFMTHLPSVDPGAFLNVIYKPTDHLLVDAVASTLGFPNSLREFFTEYNGARLFFDALRIYGCVPREASLDREAVFTLPPFDILGVNREFQTYAHRGNVIFIGSYAYDRSMVCMDRVNETVTCFTGTDFSQPRKRWTGLEAWLLQELRRLKAMFSVDGERTVDEELLLPSVVQ